MQTRTHVPGQVLSQVARGAQQNGNALNGTGLPWPPWQSEQDTGLRRQIVDNILQLFKNRKPHVTPEWQQKLPDFVKRLEEALYKNAPSKDDYADLKTLEQRLQLVARRMVPKQPSHSVSSSAPMSNMIPTPGAASNMIPTPGNGSNMMQTPGSIASMMPTPGTTGNLLQSGAGVAGGLNNMIPTPGSNNVMNTMTHGTGVMMPTPGALGNMMPTPGHSNMFNMSGSNIMATPGIPGPNYSLVSQQAIGSMRMAQNGHAPSSIGTPVGSQMIPTPGLNTSQGLGMSPATSGSLGIPNVGGVGAAQLQQQQQQFGVGTGNHIFSGMNGQVGGSLASGVQQQRKPGVVNGGVNNGMVLSNGQHLVNGAANLHTPPTYLNTSQYSSLQLQQQQQQRLSQQHQHQHQQQQQQHQLQQHQLQPQQHQRPQSLRMQSALPNPLAALTGDGYAMNAADLAGGSFSSGSLASSNLTLASTSNSPASKMIPVPGLPSQQNLQHQQQVSLQQQIQQRNNSQHQPNNGLAPRNQQQQQLVQLSSNQNLYQSQAQQSSGLGGQKQAAHDQSLQQPLPSQMQQSTSDSQKFSRQHQSTQSQMPTIQQQPQLQQQIWRQQQQQGPQRQQVPVQLPLNRLSKPASQQRQALSMMNQRQGQGHQLLQQQQQQHGSQQLQQTPQPQLQSQLQPQSQQQQSQSQPHQQLQQRGSSATQTPLQAQPVQQQQAQQRQLIQASQQSVGQGAAHQHPVLPGQLQQIQSTQPRQAVGKIGSALSPPTMTTSGLVGNAAHGAQLGGSGELGGPGVDAQRQQQYSKQQRWLLFLRHASKCTAPEGQCQITPHCHMARQLWIHIASCRDRECTFSRCNASRTLLHHHQHCRDARCPVCGPVRQQVMNHQRLQPNSLAAQQGGPVGAPSNSVTPGLTTSSIISPSGIESSPTCEPSALEELDVQQPPPKRVKIELPTGSNLSLPLHSAHPSGPSKSGSITATPAQLTGSSLTGTSKSEQLAVKSENVAALGPSFVKVEQQVHGGVSMHRVHITARSEPSSQVKATESRQQVLNGEVKAEPHIACATVPTCPTLKGDSGSIGTVTPANASTTSLTKTGKPKNCGTSLTELFTPEQIQEHITGLRQWVGQSKAKAEKNQAMEHQMSENACRLCAVEKLTFEPPPIYCTACGARIKRNASFYTTGSGDTRHYFCVPCYNEVRSENVEMEGMVYPKSKLERKKNDEETEEAWVQCDKCNLWQHQVCALFNGRRNEGDSEYICPECCCIEMERGERKSLPSSAVLGAKDLPKTFLSDHLEQRLTRKLKQERTERAKAQGRSIDEVPGAEALVVRVVSSVDKKLEVKQRFLEIFQEEDYPTEYPYRSKVVLLFQKIEGVEVCLFGMYVQEFGAECSLPNQRRVYLSYLDSVKYFRPDVRTANGEALRTFVYHEILIGYLDYCRRRGFSSCYIWACPPLKGEDYILYCHPEIQKTPKSDKLRDWYLTMLRKASNDGIVVEITNLYDHFFASTGECKAKVTAARLPYFDGDYWPGAAEDMIVQLQQEEEDVRKNALKKGKTKKQPTKRFSKGLAQVELASNASKDTQLMQKLGESIFPMKEDFIMVHMNHACTHCRLFIVSGHRWVCKQCKNFQLCEKCYDAEQKLDERDRHPINIKELHSLHAVEVNDVSSDTKDKDESMESEFFDTRQAFLSLCQGNHYQYDTLRRAKHSSMMVLYHLHNPTAPAFVVSCNVCHLDIETGNGWRCETCADFDLCNKCKDTANHPHKLAPFHDRTAQNKEARQQRVLQLRKMLELLVHASQCGLGTCQYPKCRSVKGLFRHGMNCRIRASGGCNMCKRMWYLLQLHARACKESECRVPRCKDLKEHLRRLNQQMESRRRVAVKEMMRQRAAEAAGSNS